MTASTAPPATTGAFTTIPVVSLARWRATPGERAALAEEVREICHQVGFFYLVEHGIEPGVLERAADAQRRVFALPEEVKAGSDKMRSPRFRGWERVGAELTDNRTDFREQLDLATELAPWGLDVHPPYLRLAGPNQWLDESELPGVRPAVEGLLDALAAVAGALMEVLSVGLGLDAGHLERVFGERPMSLAKLIDYPPTPPGEAGVNAHHDAGFLTLLLQQGVGGLQARNARGEWIDVPPRDDAFVVNLGEMLQAMTGNYFVATTHRVIADHRRRSIAYFHGPDLRTPLAPLPLAPSFAAAVAASERHARAGFMARRDELLAGERGTASAAAEVYGQQLWNYYVRSYPQNVRRHHPDVPVS